MFVFFKYNSSASPLFLHLKINLCIIINILHQMFKSENLEYGDSVAAELGPKQQIPKN
jgi:hypothetical protein